MSDLPSAVNVKEIISLFAPGMILLWARGRVQGGPTPDLQDRFIAYGIASTGYFAAVSPLFYIQSGFVLPHWFWIVLHYALLPLLLGWGVAFASQRGWEYSVAKRVGLQFSHHIPAAWDFAFSRIPKNTYVLATLADGSQVGGLMGSTSFASSSKDERDLLIEDIWRVDEKNEWERADPPRAALLCGSDIRYIEFF